MKESSNRLAVFQTDSGITLSFGDHTYFIDANKPFYNIALKALRKGDFVPFYIEIARQEGMGEEFRDQLLQLIEEETGDREFPDL